MTTDSTIPPPISPPKGEEATEPVQSFDVPRPTLTLAQAASVLANQCGRWSAA